MLGAIAGKGRSELRDFTSDIGVGICVLSDVRKSTQGIKFISMKADEYRVPVNIEFIRDVRYELYITGNSDKLDLIESILKKRNYEYSPYFGISEFGAKLDFVGRCAAKLCDSNVVDSIIPTRFISNIKFAECDWWTDEIPVKNGENREYIASEKIVFAFNGSNHCRLKGDITGDVYDTGNRFIYFFM